MHRVNVIVHCVTVVHYNHNRNRVLLHYLFQENKSFGTGHHLHSSSDDNRNRVLLYYLFQENKSFGTGHNLHSSSDVREVVSGTVRSTYCWPTS
jgi:hypothetical protein